MPNTWEDLENLEEDWDSYKANPITPEAIKMGKRIEQLLLRPIQFFPTADGGVSFEWHVDKDGMEIYIEPNGNVDIYISEE